MKFSKTILALVMVAVLSLSMAFVAFAAGAELGDPIVVEALDSNNAFEVTVPANSTVYYSTAKELIMAAFTDLNGVVALPENEGLTVTTYLNGWMGTSIGEISQINMMTVSVVYEITNTTAEDITANVAVAYGPGSASNPYFVMPNEDGTIAVEVPAWGATYYSVVPRVVTDKMLDVSDVVDDVTSVTVTIDGNTTEYWMVDVVDGVIPNAFDSVNTMTGSVVIGVLGPMEDIEGTLALTAKPGTYENPEYLVLDENGEAAVASPAFGEKYYAVVPFAVRGKALDVSGIIDQVDAVTVIIDGVATTYWAEDVAENGVIETAFDEVTMMTGSVMICVGGVDPVEGTVALTAKSGTYENPEYLVLDENGEAAVSAPAFGEKYYAVVPFVATGKVLDVSGIIDQVDAVTVIVDGVSTVYYAEDVAEDGIIANAFDDVNMLTGSVMICVGGVDPVEGTIALAAKAGTLENPNALILNEEGKATVSVPAGETVYYWVKQQVAADKYLILGDLDLTVSVYVDGVITPCEVDENGNVMNAFEDVDAFFTNMVLVELTNTSEEDIEGTLALGIIEEEEAPQTGVAAAILTVVAVLSGGYVVSRRRTH